MSTFIPEPLVERLRSRPWGPISAFWLLVGFGAGTTAFLAGETRYTVADWLQAVLPSLLAGLCWIPLTVGIFALARRFPIGQDDWRPRLALHLGLSLLASFALNTLYAPLAVLVGQVGVGQMLELVRDAGLRWMHVNAGAYWMLLAIGHVLVRERGAPPLAASTARLRVSSGSGSVYLPIAQIDWIEGAGDYARVHAEGRELLSDRRLKELEAELGGHRFARIHRSTIVNLERVRTLRHVSHGDYEAELGCGTRLRVARSRREQLRAALEG